MHKYSKSQMFWLVALRMLVGWHCLYEGLVKILNPKWTSMGYLLDAQGWFASWFHLMANNKNLLSVIDFMNEWGLFLIGLGLIVGCFSRLACVGGIALLGLYWLSHPHYIGVEYMLPFEGSYLFVDKNLVELGALAVLYVFPTSKIFGLDGFILKLLNKKNNKN